MPNDWLWILAAAGVLTVTYLVYSTLAIGGAWCVLRIARPRSQALIEQVWKAAAVVGVFTAAAQCVWGIGGLEIALRPSAAPSVEPNRPTSAVVNETAVEVAAAETAGDFIRVNTSGWDSATVEPLVSIDESVSTMVLDEHVPTELLIADGASLPVLTDSGDQARGVIVTPLLDGGVPAEIDAALADQDRLAASAPPPATAMLALACLGGLSALCAIVGSARLAVQSAVFRRRMSAARRLEAGAVRRELDALLRRNRIRRRIDLLESDRFAEPFACGFLRSRIVVPTGIEQRLRRDELRSLLAHELAHLVRGDTIWLWIGRVLCSCLPLQPLNFVARRRWQRAEECLCDDWAVRSGSSPVALARCLTQVAEWRTADRLPVAELAVGGPRPSLSERVERLVGAPIAPDRWSGLSRRLAVRLVLTSAAFGLVWYGPRASLPAVAAIQRSGGSGTEISVSDSAADSELDALDAELQSLQQDLQRANDLLARARLSSQEEQIAQRLERRAESVARRRAALVERATTRPR